MEIKEVINICQKIKDYNSIALIVSNTIAKDYIEDKTTPWDYNHKNNTKEEQITICCIDEFRSSIFFNKNRKTTINIIKSDDKENYIFIGIRFETDLTNLYFHKKNCHGVCFEIINNEVKFFFGWKGKELI